MKLNKLCGKKVILAATAAAFMASSVYAATYAVTSTAGSRSEVTGPDKNDGVISASGSFKITRVGSGTLKLSIMQVLNNKSGTSGGAEPITQLGLQKSGSKFSFYIVQGGQNCTSTPVISLNEAVNISVSVDRGETPTYTIGGVKCSKANPDGDRAGKIVQNGVSTTGRYYYAKYGAYGTNSNSASATVEWNNAGF